MQRASATSGSCAQCRTPPPNPSHSVEAFPLNTTGGSAAARSSVSASTTNWLSPPGHRSTCATKLKELYWKDGKPASRRDGVLGRHAALPVLAASQEPSVLEQAIRQGAASRDFFGTAYGQHEGKYDGFQLGDANIQFDDTLLLIEPEAAKQYEAAQVPPNPPLPPDPPPHPPSHPIQLLHPLREEDRKLVPLLVLPTLVLQRLRCASYKSRRRSSMFYPVTPKRT